MKIKNFLEEYENSYTESVCNKSIRESLKDKKSKRSRIGSFLKLPYGDRLIFIEHMLENISKNVELENVILEDITDKSITLKIKY